MADDYYTSLGIARDASQDDIKSSYWRLAKILHPDRPTGDERKFKEINEAYTCLGDPERRAIYDRTGHDQFVNSIEHEALSILAQAFERVFAAIATTETEIDPVKAATDDIKKQIQLYEEQIERGATMERKLRAVRDTVRRRARRKRRKHPTHEHDDSDKNLFQSLLDAKFPQIKATQAELAHHLEAAELALKNVAEYEFTGPAPKVRVVSTDSLGRWMVMTS